MTEPREQSPAATYRAAKPFLDAALEHYQGTVTDLLKGRVPEHYVIGRVKTARSLIRAVAAVSPGTSVTLSVRRQGRQLDVPVTVGLRPKEGAG